MLAVYKIIPEPIGELDDGTLLYVIQYNQDGNIVAVQAKSGDNTIKTLIEKVRKGHVGYLRNLYIYIEDNFPNINTKI